jgi:predicted PurR-regulated permease PerM
MSDRPHHPPRNQPEDGWLSRERALVLVLLAATALAVYACYRLAQPFLPALAWALALAVVTSPLHAWLLRRLHKPTLAAAVAVALVAVAVVGPTLLVTQQLVRQAASGINWLQSEASAESWRAALDRYPRLGPGLAWLAERIDLRGAVEQASTALTGGASTIVGGSVWAVGQLLITLFALFYFFRDQRPALGTLRSLVPLSARETKGVFTRVSDTIHATVFGTLTVALVQGLLGGVMFWVLGLPAALLWGALMAVLAVVPVLGAFVVWAPAAVFLALSGS